MTSQQHSGADGVRPEWNQSFQQCLQLLRGPDDERRFVGLLMVTRLLPQGSDDAVRSVLDALGTQFLHRLLLPLRRSGQASQPPPPPSSADAVEQQVTCCGLALAILAAACRLPDFARGPDMCEVLPLLVKVVQYGGVSRILGLATGTADTVGDAAIVADALECLVGAAAAGGAATSATLQGCGIIPALAAWLTAAAAVLTSVPPSLTSRGAGGGAAAEEEAQDHNGVLRAAALLEQLLARGGSAVLTEYPEATAQIVAALAELIGNPRLLLSTTQPAPAQPPPQQQQQQDPAATTAAAQRKDTDSGGRGGGGAAQLQLEGLHLLLLIMRVCQEPVATVAQRELVRLDERVAWSDSVRRGLGWVLRSRAPATLKHAALQLAACLLDVVGCEWLLGPGAPRRGAPLPPPLAAVAAAEEPGSFMLILTETLKIETGLLLQDALHPERRVPDLSTAHRTAARGHEAPVEVSQRLLDELAARAAQQQQQQQQQQAEAAVCTDAANAAGAGGLSLTEAPAEAPPAGGAMYVDDDAGASVARSASVAAAPPPASTMPAGQRALALLPACFALVEGCVQAVAADADAGADEGDQEEEEDSMEVEVDGQQRGRGRDAAPAARAPRVARPQPLLCDAAAQRLMGSFDGLVDILLEFLEGALENPNPNQQLRPVPLRSGAAGGGGGVGQQQQPPEGQQLAAVTATAAAKVASAAAAAPPPPVVPPGVLLLGAARVVSCYLAEIPVAVQNPRVLRVLPAMMALRSDGWASESGGAATRGSLGPDDDEDGLRGFALTYLLPGLLQATSPGADGRSAVTKALRGSQVAVVACVMYLTSGLRCWLATLGPHPDAGRWQRAAGLESSLGSMCLLLLNVLEASALGTLVAAAAATAGRKVPEGSGAAAAGALPSEAWEDVRAASLVSEPAIASAAAAAAAATQHLPPLLAQLAPVCWAAQRWARAREAVLQEPPFLDPLRPPPAHTPAHMPGRAGDGGSAASELLRESGVSPTTLLYISCLAAVVASTMLSYFANAAAGPERAEAEAVRAAAAAALLPPPVLEAVGGAALTAAAVGAALQLAQLRGGASAAAASGATAEGSLEDVLGQEGSECWERLLAACGQLVESSEVVRRQAAAAAGGSGGGGAWLRRLAAEARDGGDPAVAELLLSEVHLALLLQVLG